MPLPIIVFGQGSWYKRYRLFEEALEIEEPWDVVHYEIDHQTRVLDIYLDFPKGATFGCPHCGHGQAKVHDVVNVDRMWRHLKDQNRF